MLSDNKLDNYKNIQASVEKVKDEKMKQDAITALNSFLDEKLQKINDYSEALDVILKNMEFYNSVIDDSRARYRRGSIFNSIEQFFFCDYNKFVGINLEIVGFIVKHRISIPFIFQAGDFNEVCEEVNLVLKNTEFAKFLFIKGFIDNFFCRSSFVENRTLNEGLNTCIENQDLLLINY